MFSMTVQVSGKLLDMKVSEHVDKHIYGALREIGQGMVLSMQNYTSPHDFSGKLSDSLMWKSNTETGDKKTEFEISAPEKPYSVMVGTAVPYAYFREMGAGPHLENTDSDLFVASMKKWFKEKIGGDPDGEDSGHFHAILNKIREGQDAVPFAQPAMNTDGVGIAKQAAIKAAISMWSGND